MTATPLCRWGHPLTPENQYADGRCRACAIARARRWLAAHPEDNLEANARYKERRRAAAGRTP